VEGGRKKNGSGENLAKKRRAQKDDYFTVGEGWGGVKRGKRKAQESIWDARGKV